MADRFAVPTTARSIPPVIMAILIPMAIRPYSGNCFSMETRFQERRKISGLIRLIRVKTCNVHYKEAEIIGIGGYPFLQVHEIASFFSGTPAVFFFFSLTGNLRG